MTKKKGVPLPLGTRTHKIQDITFTPDYLLCVCGWEGKAYDIVGYRKHTREAEPTDKLYLGPTATTSVFNKAAVVPEKVA